MSSRDWENDPEFQALVAEYVESLNRRRGLLLSHVTGLSQKTGDALVKALQEIRAIAHNVSGTGESYGFPTVSRIAGSLDNVLTLGGADARAVEEFGALLAEVLEGAHASKKDPTELLQDPRARRLSELSRAATER